MVVPGYLKSPSSLEVHWREFWYCRLVHAPEECDPGLRRNRRDQRKSVGHDNKGPFPHRNSSMLTWATRQSYWRDLPDADQFDRERSHTRPWQLWI